MQCVALTNKVSNLCGVVLYNIILKVNTPIRFQQATLSAGAQAAPLTCFQRHNATNAYERTFKIGGSKQTLNCMAFL